MVSERLKNYNIKSCEKILVHKEKIQQVWHEMDETDTLNMFWRPIRWVKNTKVLIISIENMSCSILSVLGIALAEGYPEKHMTTEMKDKNFLLSF